MLLVSVSICTTAQAQNAQNGYVQKKLVSDMSGVAHTTDRNLVNSWGIARNPTGPWWVNDNGTGVSTLYNGNGDPFPLTAPLVVTIPPPEGGTGTATPTGIVFNGTKDFEVATNKPARFIFVTEDGTISGWNPDVNQTNAVLKADNSKSGAVYKGAALALANGVPYLYAANFHNGTVDVFDTDFKKVTLPNGAFTNPSIQAGFAPFNVVNVDGRIFVTYAKQGANKHDDVAGAGNGFVDIFTPDGTLLMSLKHGPWLNSPWGAVLAPANFGKLSNMILIGNFGSGEIAAYDLNGNFQGLMKGTDGKSITIDGLWGLGFGNGQTAGPATTLFFAAGPNGEKNGLFGTLTPGQ
jgi:uncharacterized protein (TIGR03118 family)